LQNAVFAILSEYDDRQRQRFQRAPGQDCTPRLHIHVPERPNYFGFVHGVEVAEMVFQRFHIEPLALLPG